MKCDDNNKVVDELHDLKNEFDTSDVEKTKKRIIAEIKALDKKNDGFNYQDRLDILREFCRGCGDDDPGCQCENDE